MTENKDDEYMICCCIKSRVDQWIKKGSSDDAMVG